MKMLFCLSVVLGFSPLAQAKDFEIFDGQTYNGLYYPLIDNIEWGEQDHEIPHMEFHIHSKDKRVDVALVPGKKGSTPVLWVMYDLKYRNEHVCRRVPAPAQFKEGMQLYTYRDDSDPDYDNIYIYSQPWTKRGKSKAVDYTPVAYEPCTDDNADNMPAATPAASPAGPKKAEAAPAPGADNRAPASAQPKGVGVDYDNAAVPFSF